MGRPHFFVNIKRYCSLFFLMLYVEMRESPAMKLKKNPPDDTFQIRCSKLGHQIHFSYCRKENFGLPCIKTLNCWFPHFDVEQYLREELSPEEFEQAFEKIAKPKVQTLMELIDQARKRAGKK